MSIAWFFPGQGEQRVGMGKDILSAFPSARAVMARADAALGEPPLSRTILEGPEDVLTLTVNAQPAIVATSCLILAALRERLPDLPQPAYAAGHSLGEYSALVACGALALEDAVRIVRTRGRAMQDAVAPGVGAMSAIVAVAPDRLEAICRAAANGEVVSPANFNSPGQIVIAGHAGAVARAGAMALAESGRVIPLQRVSAPFHCALMAPAAETLEAELANAVVSPLAFPVVANVDALPNLDPERVKGLLVSQVTSPVRWEESVRWMAAQGVTHALEIGPGKVLSSLVKRITKDIRVLSVSDAASLEQVAAFLRSARPE